MQERLIIYSIVLSYFAFILIKGFRCRTQIKTSDDFFLGNRQLTWFMLLCTTGATLIGGGASMGAIGKTYDWGILMIAATTGWYLQLIFSGYFIAPRFRELPVYTVAGFLGHHFGEKVHRFAGVLSLLFSLGILAAQLVAFGKIVNTLIPEISYATALWVGAIVIISYNLAGGFWAVVWTDVYQFFILLFGFGLTAAFCLVRLKSQPIEVPDYFFQLTSNKGVLFALSTFVAFAVGEMFAPGYATRFCAGKNIQETKRGIAGSGWLLLLVFPPMILAIALYARVVLPDIDPQSALPETVLKLHSPWISGIILAALMCAVMSSADSILNSGTAVVVKDLWDRFGKRPQTDEVQLLKFSRWICLGLGVISTCIAYVWPDIIGLLLWTYSLWAPMIVLPCLMAAFPALRLSRFPQAAFVMMSAACFCTILYRMILKDPLLDASVFGLLVAMTVYALFYGMNRMRAAA